MSYNNNNNNNNMYLKSSIQTSSIDYIKEKYPYNIKHIKQYTNSINQNIVTVT